MNSYLLSLILFWSNQYDVDPVTVMKVINVESSYNTKAVGKHGELGLMQLLPSSFPQYTREQLLDPKTNIKLGIKYLSECKKQCIHKDNNSYLVCYNRGVFGGNKVINPYIDKYVKKVNNSIYEKRIIQKH